MAITIPKQTKKEATEPQREGVLPLASRRESVATSPLPPETRREGSKDGEEASLPQTPAREVQLPPSKKRRTVGTTRSGKIIELTKSNVTVVDPQEDWQYTYRALYQPMRRAEDITRLVMEAVGVSLDSKYSLMNGLYLVWGSKGTGKSTRFSTGIPDHGLIPLRLRLAQLDQVKVLWARAGEPDYGTNLLFSAELQQIVQALASPYDSQRKGWSLLLGSANTATPVPFAGKDDAKVMIIDSLSALLNYQTKQPANDGERDSGACLSLSDRYLKEDMSMGPSNAATSGGVPGSIIHSLRVIQNLARVNEWLVLGLINPLQVDLDVSASKLIGQINSATNGTLPIDGAVSSYDNRFFNTEYGGPDRVDLASGAGSGDLTFTSVTYDAAHQPENINL